MSAYPHPIKSGLNGPLATHDTLRKVLPLHGIRVAESPWPVTA